MIFDLGLVDVREFVFLGLGGEAEFVDVVDDLGADESSQDLAEDWRQGSPHTAPSCAAGWAK